MHPNTQAQALLDKIIDHELAMFLQTSNQGGPAPCQEHPEEFRKWRWMSYSIFSLDFLQSYLDDLTSYAAEGRNVIMEKYARMDNIIPCISPNMEKVKRIVHAERHWLQELADKHPAQFSQQLQRFDMYFSCEIETLSEKTLDCYLECIARAQEQSINLAELRYANLYKYYNKA